MGRGFASFASFLLLLCLSFFSFALYMLRVQEKKDERGGREREREREGGRGREIKVCDIFNPLKTSLPPLPPRTDTFLSEIARANRGNNTKNKNKSTRTTILFVFALCFYFLIDIRSFVCFRLRSAQLFFLVFGVWIILRFSRQQVQNTSWTGSSRAGRGGGGGTREGEGGLEEGCASALSHSAPPTPCPTPHTPPPPTPLSFPHTRGPKKSMLLRALAGEDKDTSCAQQIKKRQAKEREGI